jgi:ferric-dicitrate binding protein FerR (iron transport regulator)
MIDNATYYTDLIARYFSGEIREDELRFLSDWLKDGSQNQELFRQYKKTWLLLEKQIIHSKVNTDQEWIAMQAKIFTPVTGIETPVNVISLNQNRNNIKSYVQNMWKAAAVLIILLASSVMLYLYLSRPAKFVITAQATNLEKVLPDGSVVSLHAGSQITYPESFSSNTRNVELIGEAYFKVTHDKTKPFIVASGPARVEVLGTQFNMNTHTLNGAMEVVLTSGKVSVYYKGLQKDNVLLMPGEKAELNTEQKHICKSTNTDPNYMAWKTHVLIFDNETLQQVVNTLHNVYQTPIQIADARLSYCRVTATFNNQSLQSVLEVIKETLDLQVNQNEGKVIISGKGCR